MDRLLPVLLPLAIFIGTGIRGLVFGQHWDERHYQIAPVQTMIRSGQPLPGYYGYPALDYWISASGSEERFVITMGLISTSAYESLRLDFGGDRVPGVGDEALVDGPDQLGDVTLVARAGDVAVMVMVSGNVPGTVGPARRRLAADVARRALERLNPATAGIRPKPGARNLPVPSITDPQSSTFCGSATPEAVRPTA